MKSVHLAVGLLGVVVFFFTGDYMQAVINANSEMTGQRMMYRASHIYIIFSSLIHLSLAAYWQPLSQKIWRVIQLSSSALLMLATVVLIVAFFVETGPSEMERNLTLFGVLSSVIAVGVQLCVVRLSQTGKLQ
jgi:hypothetical protein